MQNSQRIKLAPETSLSQLFWDFDLSRVLWSDAPDHWQISPEPVEHNELDRILIQDHQDGYRALLLFHAHHPTRYIQVTMQNGRLAELRYARVHHGTILVGMAWRGWFRMKEDEFTIPELRKRIAGPGSSQLRRAVAAPFLR